MFEESLDDSSTWTDTMLRYFSVRAIQTITFNFAHKYETQLITINSAISGSFYIIVQGQALTSAIDISTMTISKITTAMRSTVLTVSNCYIGGLSIEGRPNTNSMTPLKGASPYIQGIDSNLFISLEYCYK